MSNAKKILILTLTLIFAIAVSATVVSFSFAGGTSKDTASNEKVAVKDAVPLSMADSLADTLTNIDHIIDKANDTSLPDSERIFHIVQIVSNGNKETSLKKYVEDGNFAKYVINNNRSEGHAELPLTFTGEAGTVNTVQIDVLTVADLDTIVATKPLDYSRVTIADLMVVSNDPSHPFVGGSLSADASTNDIPEDIHKVLQPYAVGQYKPLMIDWAGTTSVTEDPNSMKSLATNVLANNYIKFRTFKWKDGISLKDFLQRKGSVYIPLEIDDPNYKNSKVLVIHGDGNASAMYDAITGNQQDFIDNAFYRKGYIPESITVDKIAYTDITSSAFADGYDFVYIENDTYSAMTSVIYNAISVVSYAKKHVIYAGALQQTTTTTTDSDNDSNYKELLYTVASKEGISLYSNVYLSNYTFFDSMAQDPANTQEAANTVAELLKASTYREFGADSASGKKFTVLELQPAYPIDEALAKKNGTYYTVGNNVYKSSKETVPEDSEYYAFEMTMEKVMALTGLDSSGIQLDQMSVEELQGIKKSILDKYDLVYIGGNVSALTEADTYNWNNGGMIAQHIKSDEQSHYVVTDKPAGTVVPAEESEDGKEHKVEAVKQQWPYYFVISDKPAGTVIPAEESGDGMEHKVEGLQQNWPSYNVSYALVDETKYSAGDTVAPEDAVDGKSHVVEALSQAGGKLGYMLYYFNCFVPEYQVGDVVPADKSIDGQEHTVASTWGTLNGYKVFALDYKVGDTVPADKSVDGKAHVVSSTEDTLNAYKVIDQVSKTGYAFYRMYSHTGAYLIATDGAMYGIKSAGEVADTGGTDITTANLKNFMAYIDAGMPIVFSDDVTQAYVEMKQLADPYGNSLIDPDSNMAKLLEYALNAKGAEGGKKFQVSSAANVLSDFDKDNTIRIANLTGKYGNTSVSGADYVEVFDDGVLVPYMMKNNKGEWEDFDGAANPAANAAETAGGKLKLLINSNPTRPTMNITKMPSIYVANTPSSYLQTPNLSFDFELLTNGNTNIVSFTVTLYIDDDSNGIFSGAGENVKSVTVSVGADGKATGSLAYQMNADFYGPVSWKLEAVANMKKGTATVTGPSISYNAISKVVKTTSEKDLVHILQIMPKNTSGQQGDASLYFCPDCQLYNMSAMYNGHLNSGVKKENYENYIAAMYQNYGATAKVAELENDSSLNSGEVPRLRSNMLKLIKDANDKKINHFGTGLHEHKFGIWKYDSNLNYDDWNSNLADVLAGDDGDFEFNIDIFCPEDLEGMVKEYSTNEVAKLQDAYAKAKKGGSEEDIAEAKKDLDDLIDQKQEAAALLYEEYENLVTLTEQKETDLRNVLQYFRDHNTNVAGVTDPNVFAEVLEEKNYNDILSNNKTAWRDYDATQNLNLTFTAEGYNDAGDLEEKEYKVDGDHKVVSYYYQRWADAKSFEVLKLEEYWEAMRASYGKDWMKEIYGIVLMGAAENFAGQDLPQDVCDALAEYEDEGGNMLMFHDTMTRYNQSGYPSSGAGKGAVNLTNTLRDAFGLNRYHMTVSAEDSSKYQVNAGYDASKYFLTRMTIAGDMLEAKLPNYAWGGANATTDSVTKRTLVGMTSNFAVYKNGMKSGPYKYAETNLFDELTNWSKDFATYKNNLLAGNFSTNRATQVNSGIITSYPFTISDKLNISMTHGQYLALDVEDDEVITWYALAGAASKHQYNSMYAADPGDAADNYFIYTKGNVSYCGAGHGKVTGPLTDNNDERMLFINIICNSARKRALKPSITVYDPDNKKPVPSTGNKYILQNTDGEPYIEVGSQTEKIKFGFLATVDTKASPTITNTRIYFRYDQNDDGKVDEKDVDEVIYTFKGEDALTSGIDYYVNTTDNTAKKIAESITLKPEYFKGYDDCAYVYIEVTDSNGEILTEKIRIDFVGDLFEMTDNSVEQPAVKQVSQDIIKDL